MWQANLHGLSSSPVVIRFLLAGFPQLCLRVEPPGNEPEVKPSCAALQEI